MSGADITALIFGPGLPPGGAPGKLVLSSLGLEVIVGEQSTRASLSAIQLRQVGFGQFGLEVSWTEGDSTWAAHVLDPAAARRLMEESALAATPQAAALRSRRRRGATGRSIGWAVLAFVVLLPALLLVLLILNANTIAAWAAEKIPVEQEMTWGRQVFASMRGTLKLQESGAALEAVRSIGARLTQGSKYSYEFYIAEDNTLNAFALPGGIIVVHTGLIAATQRPEELAGVLAHEVQHVELRHSLRGTIKELGLRGLWALVTGDLGGTLVAQAALEMTSLKFSRDDEREADQRGFDALVKAGIDPAGMPAFFKTMSERTDELPVAFISTHPLSAEREAALRARLSELKQSFASLDLGAWPPQ